MGGDLTVDCLSPYIRQWCRPGGTSGPRGSEGPSNVQSTDIFCRLFRASFRSDDRSWSLTWDFGV